MGKVISPDRIRKHYNEINKDDYIYKRWGDMPIKRHHYKQTEKALLKEFSKFKQLENVLEIGCGPAVWTNLYLDKANSVTLLDISEEVLTQARKRIGNKKDFIRYVCGDFNEVKLNVEPNKYDMIISIRAWEYMTDKIKAIQKCYELLKPHGKLLIVTKNRNWLDNKHRLDTENVDISKLPVGEAMQMDLIAWETFSKLYEKVGFKDIETYPVVIGSYNNMLSRNPGLTACDLLHKVVYNSPIANWYNSLVESYLTIGTKGSEES